MAKFIIYSDQANILLCGKSHTEVTFTVGVQQHRKHWNKCNISITSRACSIGKVFQSIKIMNEFIPLNKILKIEMVIVIKLWNSLKI